MTSNSRFTTFFLLKTRERFLQIRMQSLWTPRGHRRINHRIRRRIPQFRLETRNVGWGQNQASMFSTINFSSHPKPKLGPSPSEVRDNFSARPLGPNGKKINAV